MMSQGNNIRTVPRPADHEVWTFNDSEEPATPAILHRAIGPITAQVQLFC